MRGQVKLVVIQLSWRLEDKLVATISAKVEMSGQVSSISAKLEMSSLISNLSEILQIILSSRT
jgi:hypothetical protein